MPRAARLPRAAGRDGRLVAARTWPATSWSSAVSCRPTTRRGRCPRGDFGRRRPRRRRRCPRPCSTAIPPRVWTSPLGLRPRRRPGRPARARRGACRALVLASTSSARRWRCPGCARSTACWWRAGPARHGLQWVNGAPRAGRQALLAVPLRPAARRPRCASSSRTRARRSPWPRSSLYGPDEATAAAAAPRRPSRRSRLRGRASGPKAAALRGGARARAGPRVLPRPPRARPLAGRPRRRLDVESLPDGGPELVGAR